jgi:hypothetical protein
MGKKLGKSWEIIHGEFHETKLEERDGISDAYGNGTNISTNICNMCISKKVAQMYASI